MIENECFCFCLFCFFKKLPHFCVICILIQKSRQIDELKAAVEEYSSITEVGVLNILSALEFLACLIFVIYRQKYVTEDKKPSATHSCPLY